MRPLANTIDDTCPSPTARIDIRNRNSPGARPLWSGCATTDGLKIADASKAYSSLK
jgi:hypothetical protein